MFLLLIPQLFAGIFMIGSLALGNLQLYTLDFADGMSDSAVIDKWPIDKTPCTYKTLVFPYDRTWPEEIRGTSTDDVVIRPPEPGKRKGFAYLLYQKICEGKDIEPMFYVGEYPGPPIYIHSVLGGDFGIGVNFKPIVPTANDQVDPRYATIMPYVPRTMELLHAAADKGDPNAVEALKWTGMFTDKVRTAMAEEAREKTGQGSPVTSDSPNSGSPQSLAHPAQSESVNIMSGEQK